MKVTVRAAVLVALLLAVQFSPSQAWWGKKSDAKPAVNPTPAPSNTGNSGTSEYDQAKADVALVAVGLQSESDLPPIEYDAYSEGRAVEKVAVTATPNLEKVPFDVPEETINKVQTLKSKPEDVKTEFVKMLEAQRTRKYLIAKGGTPADTNIANGKLPDTVENDKGSGTQPVTIPASFKPGNSNSGVNLDNKPVNINPSDSQPKNEGSKPAIIANKPTTIGAFLEKQSAQTSPEDLHHIIKATRTPSMLEVQSGGCHRTPTTDTFEQLHLAAVLSQKAYQIGNGISSTCTNCQLTIGSRQMVVRKVHTPGFRLGFLGNYRGPYLIATHGTTMYIAFRGTWSTADGLADAAVDMAPYNLGRQAHGFTHSGFTAIWSRYPLQSHINAIRSQVTINNYVLCGHSLGGALGQLSALEIAKVYGTHPKLYTFGSPRAGNAAFRRSFRSNVWHYRVRYDRDIVTSVPSFGSRVVVRASHGLPIPGNPRVPNWYYHNADTSLRIRKISNVYKWRCEEENNSVTGIRLRDHSLDDNYEPSMRSIHRAFTRGRGSSRRW